LRAVKGPLVDPGQSPDRGPGGEAPGKINMRFEVYQTIKR